MSIGERIRQIRKARGLTLDKFGERIGFGKGAVSMMESGKSNVTNQTVLSICREFGIREEWLREGVEPMHKSEADSSQNDTDLIERVAKKYGLDETEQHILELYLTLGPEGRELVKQYAAKMIRDALDDSVSDSTPLTEEEIAAKTAAYNQLLKGAKAVEDALRAGTQKPRPISSGFFKSGEAV